MKKIKIFFKLTLRKIALTVILLASTFLVGYYMVGIIFGCIFNLGCDGGSQEFGIIFIKILAAVLIIPVYILLGLFEPMLENVKFLQQGYNWLYIFVPFEILYLYLLVCIFEKFRKK